MLTGLACLFGLLSPAQADALAWDWPAAGVLMSLEGTLRFEDPLELTLEKYPPMADAVTAVARVHCAADDRAPPRVLTCRVQDARMKAVTSPAYWSDVERVLQSLQASLEGSEVTLKLEPDGRIRRLKGPVYEGDRQTGALHDALTSALFWSLDLSLPGDDAPSWIQKENLLDLSLSMAHVRSDGSDFSDSSDSSDSSEPVALHGEGAGAAVEGTYLFDDARGLLLESELIASVTSAETSLVSVNAYTVTPRTWESRMSFIKIGAALEKLP